MSLNILIVEGNNPEDSKVFIKAAGSTAADNLKNLVLKLEAKSNIKIINPAKDEETKYALENMDKFNGIIFRAEKVNTHGGSLRVYIKKGKNIKIEKTVKNLLQKENEFGIKKFKTYQDFGSKVYKIRENVLNNLKKLKLKSKIIGYGSPAKATTALNFFGLSDEIDFVVEDNKLKHGKFLPGMKIPIKSKKSLNKKSDYLLVLAWNFYNEIKKNNENLAEKFISIKELEI